MRLIGYVQFGIWIVNYQISYRADYDCSKQFVFAYAKIGSYYDNWPDNSNDSSDNSDGMIAIPVELSLVLCSAKEGLTAEWSKIVYPDE